MALSIALGAWAAAALLTGADVRFTPGASVIAVFGGIAIALIVDWDFPRARWLVVHLLPIAIVLMGFGLDFDILSDPAVGITAGVALLVTAVVSFGIAFVVGKAMGIGTSSAIALGAGGAICGNTAVLAVAPLLGLPRERTALVIAAINVLGLMAFAGVVIVARALDLDATQAGIWAGASIHAVPQAIAAGEAIGPEGLAFATATKLSRVTMLVPIVLAIGFFAASRTEGSSQPRSAALRLPLFVPGFVLAALLANLVLPDGANDVLSDGGRVFLLPVLAALGLGVTRKLLMQAGGRVFATGLIAALAIAGSSLAVVVLMGN